MKFRLAGALAARSFMGAAVALLVACGGGGGDGGSPAPQPAPVLTVFAGSLQSEGSRDGAAASAQFNHPGGVAQDAAGTVYVADTGNHTIRRIGVDGVVTTIAGAAGQAGNTDGGGAVARLSSPQGLAVDAAGNLYVADTGNNAVRKLSAAGVVSTVASVNAPTRVAVDPSSGAVYVLSDTVVRKLATDGSVTVFPVQLELKVSYERFFGIAADAAGNVFLAEGPSDRSTTLFSQGGGAIRKFDPQGRQLPLGTAADGVLRFTLPADIAADASGNLYVAKLGFFGVSGGVTYTFRNVQRIAPDGSISLLAGRASESYSALTADGPANVARLADPRAISVGPGGRVVVAETATSAVRAIDAQGNVSTLAGGNGSGTRDGPGTEARLNQPQGIATAPDGSLFVVDRGNRGLRNISAAGVVTTVRAPETLTSPANVAVARNGAIYLTNFTSIGLCVDPPYFVQQIVSSVAPFPFFVSYNGSENDRVIAVDAAGNVVVNELASPVPGMANCGAELGRPTRLSVLTADGSKRLLAAGIEATALAADAFGLVDFATAQGVVGSVDASGTVVARAGTEGQLGDADGAGPAARFRSPTALAVDPAGTSYVADGTRLRRVAANGAVTTIADLATLEGVPAAAPIGGLAWSAGALFATVRNAVIRIAPVN